MADSKTAAKNPEKGLSKKEIAEFKTKLEALYKQITGLLLNTADAVKNADKSGANSQHQADNGTDDFDQTITLGLTTKEQQILKQIERALAKIEEGTYGICDISQKPIPIKRLEALPYACTTVEAQAQLEKGVY